MDESGYWRLFFATGLPEAYLAARGEILRREDPYRAAFRADEGKKPQKI